MSLHLMPGDMARLIDGETIVVDGVRITGSVPCWTCVNCGNDDGPHHVCTDCLAFIDSLDGAS